MIELYAQEKTNLARVSGMLLDIATEWCVYIDVHPHSDMYIYIYISVCAIYHIYIYTELDYSYIIQSWSFIINSSAKENQKNPHVARHPLFIGSAIDQVGANALDDAVTWVISLRSRDAYIRR